jgi:hypothetical protein
MRMLFPLHFPRHEALRSYAFCIKNLHSRTTLKCDHESDDRWSSVYMLPSANLCCNLTCRQRKLKCDERKPVCRKCTKTSRECIPSSGIVFRHQHNASMNGEDLGDENPMKGFYAYKNTFAEDAIWMDVPKNSEPSVLLLRVTHLMRSQLSLSIRPIHILTLVHPT